MKNQRIGLWLDTVGTPGEPAWIVSLDTYDDDGEPLTSNTLHSYAVDDDEDSAYFTARGYALAAARDRGLVIAETNEGGDVIEIRVDSTPELVGERIGRAIARDVIADGMDPEWTGLAPQDTDQIPVGMDHEAVEAAAKRAYEVAIDNDSSTYILSSCKGSREFAGTFREAKQAAREIQAEHQASYGVDVPRKGEDVTLYTAE